jgi:hypothetical protein
MKQVLSKATYSNIRAVLMIALLILAIGCGTPNITKDRVLDPSEGLLITRVHANMPKVAIDVLRRGNLIRSAILKGPEEYLAVIPIAAGEASFSGLNFKNYLTSLQRAYFNILPGTATYVGDIFINFTFEDPGPWSGRGWVQFEVLDKEEETLAMVKSDYPWILDRYAYRKSLPAVTLDTQKGYQELKEQMKKQEEQEREKKEKEKPGI